MEPDLLRKSAGLFVCLLFALSGGGLVHGQGLPGLPPPSGGPSELARLGRSVLFFSSEEVATMWRSDGTASGTVKVRQFDPYGDARIIERFAEAVFFETVYATRYQSGGGDSLATLWITDGTEAGTEELAFGHAAYYGSNVRQGIRQPDPGSCRFTVIGDGKSYFFVRSQTDLNHANPRSDLFSYRRNAGPPKLVHEAAGVNHIPLLGMDAGRLYFAIGNEIWSSDGETATRLLKYFYNTYRYRGQELQVEDSFFHVASDRTHGAELWVRMNGTDTMVRDINPGVNSSDPACFAQYRGLLLFSAETPEHGRELWVSDGTAEGTRMLLDIAAGEEDSSPDQFTPIDEGLLFITSRNALWKTDGTTAGTVMLAPSITRSVEPDTSFAELDGTRLFSANPRGSRYGYELYRSTGGRAALVKDINPGGAGSNPSGYMKVGKAVFFYADDGIHGRELWVTDGREEGTHMVRDLNPGSADSDIGESVGFGDRLFFVASGGDGGHSLYMSNGTEAGTRPVATYAQGSFPRALTPTDNALLYLVGTYRETEQRTDTHVTVEYLTRTELCRIDGTDSGTTVLMTWQKVASDSYELRGPLELDDPYNQIP